MLNVIFFKLCLDSVLLEMCFMSKKVVIVVFYLEMYFGDLN